MELQNNDHGILYNLKFEKFLAKFPEFAEISLDEEDGSQMRVSVVPINTDADLLLSYNGGGMVNLMFNDVSIAGEVPASDHDFLAILHPQRSV